MSSPALQAIDGLSATIQGRTPLAHLLHALNQPLTGLQCSLELASVHPHLGEAYARTLRDALELTARMRVLVEALGEMADLQGPKPEVSSGLCLNDLLSATMQELLPVAEAIGVRVEVQQSALDCVVGDRTLISSVLFRLLDSALSLAQQGTVLQILAAAEGRGALIRVAWIAGSEPEFSPFSRQELGLLIAQAGWQRTGGAWKQISRENKLACELRIPFQSAESCGERTQDGAELRDLR